MEILLTILIVAFAISALYKSFSKASKGGCNCSDKSKANCSGCSQNSMENIRIARD
ncbi:MAG: FeoB-associated Cys-rich membrane protein [Clostridiales bacterium]|jgi:hypothetical protein|nr:FeoB-associated Cys-rich membrane protein [Clostridiales bacterium]